ncbi:MAG: ATP-dependent Clp protease ATP-binding subunit [Patescibacteria group bacterium]|jgi:ATP-dependent Clp protease ATP-binding subunit ClpA
MNEIIQNFSKHLKDVLTRALVLAVEQKEGTVRPAHLFWALGTEDGSMASEILKKSGGDLDALQSTTISSKKRHTGLGEDAVPQLSEDAKQAIERAIAIAQMHDHRFIGTEHLLSGLMETRSPDLLVCLEKYHVDPHVLSQTLATVLKTTSIFSTFGQRPTEEMPFPFVSDEPEEGKSETPALDIFCDELSDPKLAKTFHPVIGRKEEIARLMQILCRRTKNNPLLVGEPGVGKTAIVEGLARMMAEKTVPKKLVGKKLYRLNLAGLIAGTMYRGEFESRLQELLEEIEARPECILFIDEVHTIMGAGAAAGSMDAAHILKPALARGALRCIGATTAAEYKKFIESDGALERRFEYLSVPEPNKEETLSVLLGITPFYESFHGVSYSRAMLQMMIDVADRYLPHKHFPDKAIDILDEVGARLAIRDKKKTVTSEDILHLLSQTIHIPYERLVSHEATLLEDLPRLLEKKIFGQSTIIQTVSFAVRKAFLGLGNPEQPLTSFLFVGPSGVGKTALAKALATTLFHHPKALLRLDMSEYAERHTVSKLLGSPAGYIGYRESALLADQLKAYPHSIILFDEIEKAHADVQHLLLQILDHGTVQDATGATLDFKQCLIVLTSNIGHDRFIGGTLGFSNERTGEQKELEEEIRKRLKEHLSDELVNRVETICIFSPLSKNTLELIAKQTLKELQARLAKHHITFSMTKEIPKSLVKKLRPHAQARDIIHTVEQDISPLIFEKILSGRTTHREKFSLEQKKDGTYFLR